MNTTSLDKLLDGRFAVEQPKKGYRIAVDTLLLASAIEAQAGQRVLDLGCGVGGVMLAIAARVPEVSIVGLEIQPYLAGLCATNIQRNRWTERLSVREGDVGHLPKEWAAAFDHVVMNPPYHDPKSHGASANDCKRIANTESDDANLSVWLSAACKALREGGTLTLIHRADRAEEIVALIRPLFGAVRMKMIGPKEGGPARRVIFRATKGGPSSFIEESPFILYGPDGRYAPETNALLRDAQAME